MNYYNLPNNHSQTGLPTNRPGGGNLGNQAANITPHRHRPSVATNMTDGGQLGPHRTTPTNGKRQSFISIGRLVLDANMNKQFVTTLMEAHRTPPLGEV
jgi:hypothetical protein